MTAIEILRQAAVKAKSELGTCILYDAVLYLRGNSSVGLWTKQYFAGEA